MRLFVLAVACAALGGCRTTAPAALVAPSLPETQLAAVRGTVEQWRQGLEVRSVDALAKLYAQDPELVVIQQGVVIRGWTGVEAALQERFARAKEIRVRLRDLTVVPIGAAGASVLATMAREVSDGVTTATEEGTLTLALRSDGSTWSIVAEHYSYVVR